MCIRDRQYVEDAGFSVVRTYVGHGVGRELHEDPEVPNFGTAGRGPRLVNGMVPVSYTHLCRRSCRVHGGVCADETDSCPVY